jgi:hypothetical protein
VVAVEAHSKPVNSIAFNPFSEFLVATASADKVRPYSHLFIEISFTRVADGWTVGSSQSQGEASCL